MKLWKCCGPTAVPVAVVLVALSIPACGSMNAEREVSAVAPASAAGDLEAAAFAGLYEGALIYRPGGAELELLLELGASGDGELVGTIDLLAYPDVTFKPLESFRVEGRKVYFSYRNDSEARGPNALFEFEAELSADGETLSGGFRESRGLIPFELQRIGDPGAPRPQLTPRPVTDLSAGYADLKDAFNAHPDHARLVILLSPT